MENESEKERMIDLFELSDVVHVRRDIQQIVGSTVELETNGGRHKSITARGIVINAYPSIFVIQLKEQAGTSRTVSFSYTDILTNTVELTLCD